MHIERSRHYRTWERENGSRPERKNHVNVMLYEYVVSYRQKLEGRNGKNKTLSHTLVQISYLADESELNYNFDFRLY